MAAAPSLSDRTMPDFIRRHPPMRAKTALMILLSMGVEPDRIEILADGENENYKGEIRHQEPSPGEALGRRDRVVLRIGRYGGFDQFPYQFFYGLDDSQATRSADWEERARRLTAPFDAARERFLARAEFEQLRFQFGFADRAHLDRYLELFGLDAGRTAETIDEALLWMALMPPFNEWAGNATMVASALEFLFGYEFEITENCPGTYPIPETLQYRLGDQTGGLGDTSILGDRFTECDSAYRVTVKRVRPGDLRSFLPGQPNRIKLERVLGLCMPGHFQYEIRVEPLRRRGLIGEEAGGAFLGYSAFG